MLYNPDQGTVFRKETQYNIPDGSQRNYNTMPTFHNEMLDLLLTLQMAS
jgi:hypothetical protein